jgi:hypothetical protein
MEFIAEQDLDEHFDEDAVVTGEPAYCDDLDCEESYSYDSPREVVYEDCFISRRDGFLTIEKRYQTEFNAKEDQASMQLVVDTGWKSDWMSERTKMKKRIDECRKNDMPCGFLRAEWEMIVERVKNAYDDKSYKDMIDDWRCDGSIDFFTLVQEVEEGLEEDED